MRKNLTNCWPVIRGPSCVAVTTGNAIQTEFARPKEEQASSQQRHGFQVFGARRRRGCSVQRTFA